MLFINRSYCGNNPAYAASQSLIPVVVPSVGSIGYIKKVDTGFIPMTSDKRELNRDGQVTTESILNILPQETAVLAVERYASK